MVASAPEIVVTGLGVVCAAGIGQQALLAALRENRRCGRPAGTPLPVSEVAAVPDPVTPDPDFPDDRKAWLALTALDEALAGRAGAWEGQRLAVYLGTGLSSVTPGELAEDIYPYLVDAAPPGFDRAAMGADLAADRAAPRRHQPERVTLALARRAAARTGANLVRAGTNFSACAAAAMAIAEGCSALRRGLADVALVGGHDSMLHPLGLLSFVVLGALSPDVCRPFDRQRNGFMIGEGAALLVLERATDVAARGGRVRARLLGSGTSVDAYNATAPHPEGAGAERAMRAALADAGLRAEQITYVNAHGTGTPVGDVAEANAIARVLGEVPVSSIKGAVGHTIAAAGAVEAAACVLALESGFLPGTVGLEQPDPHCPVPVLREPRAQATPGVILSDSFGFGGQNCVLALAHPAWEGPRARA